jgi:hypothetical protein
MQCRWRTHVLQTFCFLGFSSSHIHWTTKSSLFRVQIIICDYLHNALIFLYQQEGFFGFYKTKRSRSDVRWALTVRLVYVTVDSKSTKGSIICRLYLPCNPGQGHCIAIRSCVQDACRLGTLTQLSHSAAFPGHSTYVKEFFR